MPTQIEYTYTTYIYIQKIWIKKHSKQSIAKNKQILRNWLLFQQMEKKYLIIAVGRRVNCISNPEHRHQNR